MAINRDTLGTVAALADDLGVLSLYVDADPSQQAQRPTAWEVQIKNELAELRSALDENETRERASAIRAALEELEPEIERTAHPSTQGRGRALFVALGASTKISLEFQLPIETRVVLSTNAFIRPLIAAFEQGRSAGLVTLSRSSVVVYGWDFGAVEAFCQHILATRSRLDLIVNNACQTVRRPPEFYKHMMDNESAALDVLPEHVLQLVGVYEGLRGYHMLGGDDHLIMGDVGPAIMPTATDLAGSAAVAGLTDAAKLSQTPLLADEVNSRGDLFPEGRLDRDLQQVDLRDRNSWRLLLHEVSSVELLETQLVNAVAPFVLNARLKPLMASTPGSHKHVVNVSAVEGQFYRLRKTTRHPHTNMAKAALNMMTRTSATDFHASGIHMNSVDTGWVSDEDPAVIAEQKTAEHRFHPPLDIVDGAARIVDPIIDGLNSGVHVWGQFLKDYAPTDW